MKDCKELKCPFLNTANMIIGRNCMVTSEECPRVDNKIDTKLVMTTILLRCNRVTSDSQTISEFIRKEIDRGFSENTCSSKRK